MPRVERGCRQDDWDDGHYVVVIGFDRTRVYFEEPSLDGRRGWLSHQELLDRWHCWTLGGEKAQHQAMLFRTERSPRRIPLGTWQIEHVDWPPRLP